MKTSPSRTLRALTLIELLVLLFLLVLLGVFFFPAFQGAYVQSQRYQCMDNLKRIGLAFRVWEGDNNDQLPMQVSITNGGTQEFIQSGKVVHHFLVLSNTLEQLYGTNGPPFTPKILRCPADSRTQPRNDSLGDLSNENISYFIGVDALETNAQMFLIGDRNSTNGTTVKNGLLTLTTNQSAGWTRKIHNRQGNIGMADACVQQFSTSGLRAAIQHTGVATNRLAMP